MCRAVEIALCRNDTQVVPYDVFIMIIVCRNALKRFDKPILSAVRN